MLNCMQQLIVLKLNEFHSSLCYQVNLCFYDLQKEARLNIVFSVTNSICLA